MAPAQARISTNPLQEAFEQRRPLMPWSEGTSIEADSMHTVWASLSQQTPGATDALAYVHIPICSTHCLFCHFYRNATRTVDSASYADQVALEIQDDSATLSRPTHIHAAYLGGGTPTDLDSGSLAKILHALRTHLPLTDNCEITVEGRPYGFTEDKVEACLESGANRFSFGVQTFDTDLRRKLGRKHTGPDIIRFLQKLRKRTATATIVIDLIYGLPGQSEASWRQDLATLEDLGLDGVDLYCYSMIPGSPLAKAIQQGRFATPHPTAEQARLYGIGSDWMESHGWPQISSAHFASSDRERNCYNRLIKSGLECHAYGAGAGGNRAGYAYSNLIQLPLYREAIENHQKPLATLTRMSPQARLCQHIMGEVEAGQIAPATWPTAPASLREAATRQLHDWQRAGLLTCQNGIARLNKAGRFWHSNLTLGLQALILKHDHDSGHKTNKI